MEITLSGTPPNRDRVFKLRKEVKVGLLENDVLYKLHKHNCTILYPFRGFFSSLYIFPRPCSVQKKTCKQLQVFEQGRGRTRRRLVACFVKAVTVGAWVEWRCGARENYWRILPEDKVPFEYITWSGTGRPDVCGPWAGRLLLPR
jgi:hypothetical protein